MSLSLRLSVDPRSGYPIYLQIVAQVQRAVALGMLAAGEQLPTVKQLASDLIVNPSTISRAMRELEHLGVIVSYAGRGSFVSETAATSIAADAASKTVGTALRAALREAHELGVDARTARELLEGAFEAVYAAKNEVVRP
jgi:GntR family transcriptional regulator